MIIKLKTSVEILDEIPYILLIPRYQGGHNNFFLHDLNLFLQHEHQINHIGLQTPFHFQVEEQDFIIGLKRNPKDDQFCALKILFKSFFDNDIDYKLEVLFSLQQKYNLEFFDGKDHGHLSLSSFNLKEHIRTMQEAKKEEFIANLLPVYLLN
jgi:hypothetical protein